MSGHSKISITVFRVFDAVGHRCYFRGVALACLLITDILECMFPGALSSCCLTIDLIFAHLRGKVFFLDTVFHASFLNSEHSPPLFLELNIEPGSSHMLGKCYTTDLNPQ